MPSYTPENGHLHAMENRIATALRGSASPRSHGNVGRYVIRNTNKQCRDYTHAHTVYG